MFSNLSKKSLVKAVFTKNQPVYVQFYVTARCNLTCQQCNIIYANSDVRECTLDEVRRIADNFAGLGVAIVLLTGGEPFVRNDLPDIIYAFESRGVHVRMQTNGLASEEQIHKAIEYGGNDISVSLDSLRPNIQDVINGGFNESWHKALEAIATFTKYLPEKDSFGSFGCVIQRNNLNDITNVIRFGTRIGWFTSLVPVHVTDNLNPLGFRTFDNVLRFREYEYPLVDRLVETLREMRKNGFLLYDSDQYLDDVKRFIRKESSVTWRSKNAGVCDSPSLYFAVLPNGEFAPCCDHRIETSVFTYEENFPELYRSRSFRTEVFNKTSNCIGCMYGSYPEVSISMRFFRAQMQRIPIFFTSTPARNWPISYEELLSTINELTGQAIEPYKYRNKQTEHA